MTFEEFIKQFENLNDREETLCRMAWIAAIEETKPKWKPVDGDEKCKDGKYYLFRDKLGNLPPMTNKYLNHRKSFSNTEISEYEEDFEYMEIPE